MTTTAGAAPISVNLVSGIGGGNISAIAVVPGSLALNGAPEPGTLALSLLPALTAAEIVARRRCRRA